MTLTADLAALKGWLAHFPALGVELLGNDGGSIYTLDLMMIGALNRSMSLASGFEQMVDSKNMVCARALLRMHLDTITRLRGYTYVDDPSTVAAAVLGGKKLSSFRAKDGEPLRDGYLVERFSREFPWAKDVYASTSGYVHFSESQFFDSVQSVDNRGPGTFELAIGREDTKLPDSSWEEVVACFNEITAVLVGTLESYYHHKGA